MASAIGMVEARAFTAAIAAADAMLKAAQVTLSGPVKRVDPGLMTVTVTGGVSAVRAAVDAGAQEAARVGELVSAHVIARPGDDIDGLLR
ncbi:MAG: BMC domain-containing protein [Thermoleophilia bacterium]|nr:BMC domain-containing protein [Thermoleophilia bacterium]